MYLFVLIFIPDFIVVLDFLGQAKGDRYVGFTPLLHETRSQGPSMFFSDTIETPMESMQEGTFVMDVTEDHHATRF